MSNYLHRVTLGYCCEQLHSESNNSNMKITTCNDLNIAR